MKVFQLLIQISEKKANVHVFIKDDCDYVFININKDFCYNEYLILDKDFVFKNIMTPDGVFIGSLNCNYYYNGSNREIKKDFKLSGKGKALVYIHRAVCGLGFEDTLEVDHISHNHCIATREMLRTCTHEQNIVNKKFSVKVDVNKNIFEVKNRVPDEDRRFFINQGYCLNKNRIISPAFSSMDEMYKALNAYEKRYLGEYRYNPLSDFEETWYAYALFRFTNLYSAEDIMKYQRDYYLRTKGIEFCHRWGI